MTVGCPGNVKAAHSHYLASPLRTPQSAGRYGELLSGYGSENRTTLPIVCPGDVFYPLGRISEGDDCRPEGYKGAFPAFHPHLVAPLSCEDGVSGHQPVSYPIQRFVGKQLSRFNSTQHVLRIRCIWVSHSISIGKQSRDVQCLCFLMPKEDTSTHLPSRGEVLVHCLFGSASEGKSLWDHEVVSMDDKLRWQG